MQIIVDDIKKGDKTMDTAILITAFVTGFQLGTVLINYSGKAIFITKNLWKIISNNLQERF